MQRDVNAEHRLRRGLARFVKGRNVANESFVLEGHNETTPGCARQGSTWKFGVSGPSGAKELADTVRAMADTSSSAPPR